MYSSILMILNLAWYNNIENRRGLFEKFAKENNFDPLVSDNWTQLRLEKLSSYQVKKQNQLNSFIHLYYFTLIIHVNFFIIIGCRKSIVLL